jgi:hypothetical protein
VPYGFKEYELRKLTSKRCTGTRYNGQQCQLMAPPGAERCHHHSDGGRLHAERCRCFPCRCTRRALDLALAAMHARDASVLATSESATSNARTTRGKD